jgi:hypothetical protein
MRTTPPALAERFTGPIVKMSDPHDGNADVWIDTVRRGRSVEIQVAVPRDSVIDAHDWFRAGDLMMVSGRVIGGRGRSLRVPEPQLFQRVADAQIF